MDTIHLTGGVKLGIVEQLQSLGGVFNNRLLRGLTTPTDNGHLKVVVLVITEAVGRCLNLVESHKLSQF